MANLPIVPLTGVQTQQENLRMDPEAVTAPTRAIGQAGQQLSRTAFTIAAVDEAQRVKREQAAEIARRKEEFDRNTGKVAARKAVRLTSEQMRLRMAENPTQTRQWVPLAEETWSAAEAQLREQNLSGVALQEALQVLAEERQIAIIQTRAQAAQRDIEVANGLRREEAFAASRAGDLDEARAIVADMEVPDNEKQAMLRGIVEEGIYYDAKLIVDDAQDIASVDAALAVLNEQGDDGRYKNFEYEDGGLRLNQRQHLKNTLTVRRAALERQALRDLEDAQAAIKRGEPIDRYLESADIPEFKRQAMLQLQGAQMAGKGDASPEFEALSKKITEAETKALRWLPGFNDFEFNQTEQEKLWAQIAGLRKEGDAYVPTAPAFNYKATAALVTAMLKAERRDMENRQEDFEGFGDRDIEPYEVFARDALVNRLSGLAQAAAKNPTVEIDPVQLGRAYFDLEQQIRADADAGNLTDANKQEYVRELLPEMLKPYLTPLYERQTDAAARQAFDE